MKNKKNIFLMLIIFFQLAGLMFTESGFAYDANGGNAWPGTGIVFRISTNFSVDERIAIRSAMGDWNTIGMNFSFIDGGDYNGGINWGNWDDNEIARGTTDPDAAMETDRREDYGNWYEFGTETKYVEKITVNSSVTFDSTPHTNINDGTARIRPTSPLSSTKQSFKDSMLHELGHVIGLNHVSGYVATMGSRSGEIAGGSANPQIVPHADDRYGAWARRGTTRNYTDIALSRWKLCTHDSLPGQVLYGNSRLIHPRNSRAMGTSTPCNQASATFDVEGNPTTITSVTPNINPYEISIARPGQYYKMVYTLENLGTNAANNVELNFFINGVQMQGSKIYPYVRGGIVFTDIAYVKIPDTATLPNGIYNLEIEANIPDDVTTNNRIMLAYQVNVNSANVINDRGILVYYNFDSGTVINSGSLRNPDGTNLTVTYIGATATTAGKINGGFDFNGNYSYIETIASIPETNFSVEFWFKTSAADTGLFSLTSESPYGHAPEIYLKGGKVCQRNTLSGTPLNDTCSIQNYNDNVWHHFSYLIRQGWGTDVYVDGNSVLYTTNDQTAITTSHWFEIGSSLAYGGFFTGSMDEFYIYNYPRTEGDIRMAFFQGWSDATAGNLLSFSDTDDGSATINLPFNFSFYGNTKTSVQVNVNGFLSFGSISGNSYTNAGIPNSTGINDLIAVYWDDLILRNTGSVYWSISGTSPNRVLTIQWNNLQHYNLSADWTRTISFQVQLHETTNQIEFFYLDTYFGNSAYDYGASATIGMEDSTGTQGTQYSYNTASLANGRQINYDLTLQNETITDTRNYYALNSITARDNFIINSGANVTLKAGKIIHLQPGFRALRGSTFRAKIE